MNTPSYAPRPPGPAQAGVMEERTEIGPPLQKPAGEQAGQRPGLPLGFSPRLHLPLLGGLFLGLFLAAESFRNFSAGVMNPALAHPPSGQGPGPEGGPGPGRGSCESAPGIAEFRARSGKDLFDAGEYESALGEYLAAARLNPLNAACHRELGLVYHKLGRFGEADAAMDLAAKLGRTNPDLQFKAGLYFLLLRAHPPAEGGRMVVDEAEIAARSEASRKAQEAFRRAASIDLAYLGRAISYYEKCSALPQEIEMLVPETREGLAGFASYLAARGEWAASARTWDRLVAGFPPAENAWRLEAARAHLLAGEGDRAKDMILDAARRAELSADDVARVARMYLEGRKSIEGIQTLNVLRTHVRTDKSRIYTQMGKLWWELGNMSSAMLMFDKSAQESHDPEAYYHLALISELSGDSYSAERFFLQAVRADRDNPLYRYRLGLLYRREKRISEAITELEEAVRLAPGIREYQDMLMEIMRNWKQG